MAVSLAGSLFFNLSIDAARPRIILYLAITMAPFAVVAPLIGPFVALGAEEGRPAGEIALLVGDGVAQVGSLAMVVTGLLLRQRWLVPSGGDVSFAITPAGARLDIAF